MNASTTSANRELSVRTANGWVMLVVTLALLAAGLYLIIHPIVAMERGAPFNAKELIAGLEKFKAQAVPELPLAFFTWHDKIEEQHKAHVWDELRACYDASRFREAPFVDAGVKMLDAVKVFWDGLDKSRHPQTRVA